MSRSFAIELLNVNRVNQTIDALLSAIERFPNLLQVARFGESEPLKHRFEPAAFRELCLREWNSILFRSNTRQTGSKRRRLVGMENYGHYAGWKVECSKLKMYLAPNPPDIPDVLPLFEHLAIEARSDWGSLFPFGYNDQEIAVGRACAWLEPTMGGSTATFSSVVYLAEYGLPFLPPVYTLGPMYVRLIGLDRLLGTPGGVVRQVAEEQVLIRLIDSFDDLRENYDSFLSRRRAVIDHIGWQFFVAPDGTPAEVIPETLKSVREYGIWVKNTLAKNREQQADAG